ncbi:signal recognition particle protein [Candidatus Woesearchaeota archaeon CG10_big_fil_rev_8_21_14_0_10_44_13]|nr:MAG: signal recognition particle protein [Candidatus Woesearchaeota archaeon CG10_big_fil_rev_8_21_14_0_10_44_13]
MVLEKLGTSLKDTLQKVARAVFVDEKLINELIKDIQKSLFQSDVNVKMVFELTKNIKERFLKEEAPGAISKKEWLIKIVYEELVRFLGEEQGKIDINPKKKPFKIMMVGLFGNGKTTTIGKLARFYAKRSYKVATIGLDVHRPAAPDQLEQISKSINVPCFIDKKEKNALKIYQRYEKDLSKFDIVIVDTAGRDALSDGLIKELNDLNKKIKPDENLLVIGADVGQAAQKQAEKFHEACGVTGVIITKLDGTAKGGGALAACSVTGAKVKFIGVGEKPEDLEEFKPKNFVGRLLGMGDLEALLEKAKDAISEEDAKDLGKKFLKGEFNLIDLYEQLQAVKKMGPLGKVMEMIPGFGQLKMPKDMLNVQEGKLEKWKHAMDSMTKEELEDPESISGGRLDRIAKGAGVSTSDVRDLVKQYRMGKKMMKMFKGGNEKSMEKMMKRMGGMKGLGMGMK